MFISRKFEQYAIYTMQAPATCEIKKNETSFKQVAYNIVREITKKRI